MLVLVLLAVLLLLLAGVLAGAEAALSRVPRARVQESVEERRRGAGALQHVVREPGRALAASTLLRVVAEAGTAACLVAAALLAPAPTWVAVLAAGAVAGLAVFLAVGVAPRTLGRLHPLGLALATAPVVRAVDRLLGPLARLLVSAGNALTPGPGLRDGPFATEAELRELVDRAGESGVVEAEEREMVQAVFELGDTLVREVMVPRTDTVAVTSGTSLHKAFTLFLRSGFSRVPVVGEGLDDVRGVLYLKDVARAVHEDPTTAQGRSVEDLMRPPVFVPESKPVDAVLREMQRDSSHVALVVDEYGGIAGLVTIEDVLEEIVGEISDEYDPEAPTVEQVEDGTYRVSTRMHLDELGELLGVDIDDEEVDTVGGLLAKTIGRVPIPGATGSVGGVVITAERTEGRRNRIATALVRRERVETAEAPEAEVARA